MKRILSLLASLILTLFFAFSCFAKPVKLNEVMVIGKVHLRAEKLFWKGKIPIDKHTILGVREIKNKGNTLAYVIDMSPGGCIVVSPDTDIDPVIAYSFKGSFPIEDTEDNVFLHLLKWDMENRLEALLDTPENLKKENNKLWTSYIAQEETFVQDLASGGMFGPWLKTAWFQGDYNKYCPLDPSTGRRSYEGCVATAMGQIVNYWKYPSSLNFSWDVDHYISSPGTTSLVKIDEDHTLRGFPSFAELNQKLSNIKYDGNNDEISALCFACGISVKMNYGSGGSSGFMGTTYSVNAYSRFGYVTTFMISNDTSFYSTLKQNMIDAMPAQISISDIHDPSKGHSIVVDGFRDNWNRISGEFYHLNFGWGVSAPDPISECWYIIPSGMPDHYEAIWGGALNIHPLNSNTIHVSITGNDTTGSGSESNPYRTIQKSIDNAKNGYIVLVANGTYTGTGNINLDFNGKKIIVRSINGASNCIIDCGNLDNSRGFYFHSGEDSSSVVNGFTIQNGKNTYGAGVHCDKSSPTITNNIMTQNSGSGIYCTNNSNANITNNVIIMNSAPYGSGIYCNSSAPVIINNTIADNSSSYGSGICCENGASPMITNTILWNKTSQEVYFCTGANPNAITISYSDVKNGEAGIITNNNGTLNWLEGNIEGDPLFVNAANGNYHLFDHSPCIGSGTTDNAPPSDIEGNIRPDPTYYADPDMGAYENKLSNPYVLQIKSFNCAPNPVDSGGKVNCTVLAIDYGNHSISYKWTATGGSFSDPNIQNSIWTAPANNSYSNANYTITVVATCNSGGSDTKSCQLTVNRVLPNMIYVATTGNDSTGDGSEAKPYSTIQKGIDSTGGTVIVSDGVYKGAGNVNLNFKGKAITVRSKSGAAKCIIDCEKVDNTRGFVFQSNENSSSILDGFTIRNGNKADTVILCYNSSPKVVNNIIKDNSSMSSSLYCYSSNAIVMNNTFTGNTSNFAIYCYSSSPKLINNTIAGNSAKGLYCYGASSPIITNTIFWNTNQQEIGLDTTSTISISYSDVKGGKDNIYIGGNGTLNWGNGNIDANPLFIDAINGNYHLSDISPCLGIGTPTGAPSTDIEGHTRPDPSDTNPDMGAYESKLGKADVLTITSVSGTPNTVDPSGKVNCSVTATDSLGHSISYEWTATGGTFSDPNVQNPVWNAPDNNINTNVSYTLTAKATCSGGKTDTKSCEIAVKPKSDVVNVSSVSGTPNPVNSNDTVNCSVTATDLYNHNIIYNWTATGGSFTSSNVQNPTWTAPKNNSNAMVYYTLTITATCSNGKTDTKSYQQAVKPKSSQTIYTSLKAGWNMVSYPGALLYPLPRTTVLPGSNIIPPFYKWNPTSFSYEEVTDVKPDESYWVLTTSDEVQASVVMPIFSITIDLKAGWNMIGSVIGNVDFTNPQDNPDGSVIPPIYTYNPQTFSYEDKTTIESNKGYWTLALQDCTLTLSSGAAPSRDKKPVSTTQPDWMVPIQVITNKSIKEIALGVQTGASDGFDPYMDVAIPPKAEVVLTQPEVSFLIKDRLVKRLSRDIRNYTNVIWNMEVENTGETELRWDVSSLPTDKDMVLQFAGTDTDMRVQNRINVPSGKYVLAIILRDRIPQRTEVLQNYPNPFNPETWIPYQLSEGGKVVIGIYDVSGCLVKRLDLGHKEVGMYVTKEKSAYWDGRNEAGEKVSSGVYFYQIQSGKFSKIMKLVVIR